MVLSRQADYAGRAKVDIAGFQDRSLVLTDEIARQAQFPGLLPPRIIASLSKAQLIHAYRGARDGITLARPASEISMLDVIQAIDGPIRFNRCTYQPSRCDRSSFCYVHPIWRQAQNHSNQLLGGTKLSDLAGIAREGKPLESVLTHSEDFLSA
jgi:Rrf2 family protein